MGQDPGSHLHYGGSVWLSLIKSNKLVAGICCYLQCHSHPPFLPVQFLINTRTRGSCSFHLPARTKMASCPPDVMGSWLSLHPGVTLWKKHCTKNDAQLPGQVGGISPSQKVRRPPARPQNPPQQSAALRWVAWQPPQKVHQSSPPAQPPVF